jgi:hypothetical protein
MRTQARAHGACHHEVLSVTSPAPQPPDRPLPDVIDSSGDDGDRISITDVNGTVARFGMSYSPPSKERVKFGPPFGTRIPSLLYLAMASVVAGIVTWGYSAPSTSKIFIWVVEGDRSRPLSAQVLAAILVVSAIATVVRTHMRGVIVSGDWIEARYLLPLGIPRAKRWGWPQVHRLVVDGARIAIELMDGSFERLPEVAEPRKLLDLLMHHAARRKIHVTELARKTRP